MPPFCPFEQFLNSETHYSKNFQWSFFFFPVSYHLKGGQGTHKNDVQGDDKILISFAISNYKYVFTNNIHM